MTGCDAGSEPTSEAASGTAVSPVGRRGMLTGLLGVGAVAGGAALTAVTTAPAHAEPDPGRTRFVMKSVMPFNVKDFGATGDGETDDSAAIQEAITAAEGAGASVFLPAGTYRVTTPWRAEQPVTLRGEGMWHTTIAVDKEAGFIDAGTRPPSLVVEDIAFDNLGRKQVTLEIDGGFVHDFVFRRCRFTNLRSENLGPENSGRNGFPAVSLLYVGTGEFTDCFWHNPAAYAGEGMAVRLEGPLAHGGGNRLRFTGGNRILWLNNGIRIQTKLYQHGANGEVPPSLLKSLEIDGAYLDGFWWLMPASHAGEGSGVTYTETTLKHVGEDFSDVPAAKRPRIAIVRAMPLRHAGTVSVASATMLVDEKANFVEAGVRRTDLVRSDGRWAVVSAEAWSEANPDAVQVEEWFDNESLLPTTPPAAGAKYTVYGIIYGEAHAAEGDTLTLDEAPRSWHDMYGNAVVPEDGTRYEVLRIRHTYLLTLSPGGVRDFRLTNSTLRRGWADMAGVRPQSSQIIGNLFEDGQEHGIALARGGHPAHQVIGNQFRHIGGYSLFLNETEAVVIGNHAQGGRWKRDDLGSGGGGDFVIVNGQRCHVAHNIGTAGRETRASVPCVSLRQQDNYAEPTQPDSTTGNVLLYNRRHGHDPNEPDVTVGVLAGAEPGSIGDNEIIGSRRIELQEGIAGQHVEMRGTGSPEGVVPASPGSTFLRTDGGQGEALYVKESGTGAIGWVAMGAGDGGSAVPPGATVVKTSTTARSGTDELAADPHLSLPVDAGGVYQLEAFLIYRSTVTADISFGWSAPEGSTLRWSVNAPATSTDGAGEVSINRSTPQLSHSPNAGGADNADVCATPIGLLTVGDTAGDLTLNWAQRVAEDDRTYVKKGSYVRLVRVA